MQQRRATLEAEINKAETEIAQYERELATFSSAEESLRLSQLLAERRSEAERAMAEWESVSQALEEATL